MLLIHCAKPIMLPEENVEYLCDILKHKQKTLIIKN